MTFELPLATSRNW